MENGLLNIAGFAQSADNKFTDIIYGPAGTVQALCLDNPSGVGRGYSGMTGYTALRPNGLVYNGLRQILRSDVRGFSLSQKGDGFNISMRVIDRGTEKKFDLGYTQDGKSADAWVKIANDWVPKPNSAASVSAPTSSEKVSAVVA